MTSAGRYELSPRALRTAVWLSFAALVVAHVAGLGDFVLLDVDEPKFVAASREMARGGDAIVPHFNGAERFDKPILIYWLQALCMLVLGQNELAARLPSALSVAGTLPLVALGIAPRFGLRPTYAWLAGLAVATSGVAQALARGATADALLLFATTALAVLQLRVYFGARRWWDHAAVWLCGGLAFLVKGPPALVAPLALAAGMLAAGHRPSPLRLVPGFLLGAGVVLAWAVPALIRSDGRFWTVGVLHHVVARSVEPFEGHGGYAPWWYLFYVVAIPLAALPWSPFLLKLRDVPRGELCGDRRHLRLLAWWFGGTFAVFTVATSKLAHYPLPAFPPLMVVAMLALQNARNAGTAGATVADRWIGRVLIALGLALPVAAVGLFVGFRMTVPGGALATGACFAFGAVWAGRCALAGRCTAAALGMAVTAGAGFGLAASTVVPPFFARGAAAAVRDARDEVFPADLRVYDFRMAMPSLTYYLDREIHELPDSGPGGAERAALERIDEPGVVVITRGDRLALLVAAVDALPDPARRERVRAALARPRATLRGFLPSKGKVLDLVVLGVQR
ncbi:MAG: glycosyltransferase family 39 protein [Planctomycetes bacterium]|nr:glycosyltransferase family 39 protein [Planctomycetota bacterium]